MTPGGPAATAPLPEAVTHRLRRRWWPVALAAAGLAVLGVGLALTLREDPLPTARLSPSVPATSPTPASPTPTPATPTPVVPLQAAADQFEAALRGLDPEVAQELADRVNEALGRFAQGDQGEALEKMDEIRGRVEELAAEEKISSSQADALLVSVASLESAILATEVPAGEDSGSGQGKGKGRGQDKGEED